MLHSDERTQTVQSCSSAQMATPFACSFNIFYIYQAFILLFHKTLHPPSFSLFLSICISLSFVGTPPRSPNEWSFPAVWRCSCFLLAIQSSLPLDTFTIRRRGRVVKVVSSIPDRGNIVGWVFHPTHVTGTVSSSEHAFPYKFLIYLEHCPRGEAVIIGHLRLSTMR